MIESDSPLVSAGEDGALFTVDISGQPETGGAALGRILGGLALFILAGLFAIACVGVYFVGPFIPAITDWADLIGEVALFVGAIALGLAIVGFELMRRGRRKR